MPPLTSFPLGHQWVLEVRNISQSAFDVHLLRNTYLEWNATLRPQSPFVTLTGGEFSAPESWGNFKITDKPANATTWQTIDTVGPDGDAVAIRGRLGRAAAGALAAADYVLSLRGDGDGAVRFALDISPAPGELATSGRRACLQWGTEAGEQFYGLGEQYTVHGMRGRTVGVLTQEQGVGRGLEPISFLVDLQAKYHNSQVSQ